MGALDIAKGVGSSLWGMAKEIYTNPTSRAAAWTATGLGVGYGLMGGGISGGMATTTGGLGGASIGFAKGGAKGAIIGAVAGSLGMGGMHYLGDKALGGFGGAAVAGVGMSLAASLKMGGLAKGGMFYGGMLSSMKGVAKAAGINENEFIDQYSKLVGRDVVNSGAGFMANISEVIKGQAAMMGKGEGIANFIEKHPTMTKLFDATFGSPQLLKLAEQHGGLQAIPNKDMMKAIGKDIYEGIPLGLAFGAVGYAFSGGKKSSSSDGTRFKPRPVMMQPRAYTKNSSMRSNRPMNAYQY